MKHFYLKLCLLVFSLFASLSIHAHDFEVSGIYYVITSSSSVSPTVEVSFFKGQQYDYLYSNKYTGNVTIPETVTYSGVTYSVTSIGDYAFSDCSGLTSITIPSSVTSISNSAFLGCSGLTSIKVDAGNTIYDSRDNSNAIIETSTNKLVTGCQNTIIPSSVTSIGDYAFSDCSGLTSITIPSSVTSISNSAFLGCSGLTNITIPSSVTSIGNYAFEGCLGLTSITIPSSVTSIGDYAFSGSGLTSVTIPSSVTSIGYCAFFGCSGLTSITVPSSVTSIGSSAFSGCSGLTIYADGNTFEPFLIWGADYTSNIIDTNTGKEIIKPSIDVISTTQTTARIKFKNLNKEYTYFYYDEGFVNIDENTKEVTIKNLDPGQEKYILISVRDSNINASFNIGCVKTKSISINPKIYPTTMTVNIEEGDANISDIAAIFSYKKPYSKYMFDYGYYWYYDNYYFYSDSIQEGRNIRGLKPMRNYCIVVRYKYKKRAQPTNPVECVQSLTQNCC